jgi:homoserine kinase type II
MAVFTPLSLDDLDDLLAQFHLGKPLALNPISSGIENSNFFLTSETGEYVLTIFEKLTFEQLPFYLKLMRHLVGHGVLAAAPIPDRNGVLLHAMHGKPCAILNRLDGRSQLEPAPLHCAAVGAALAKMHMAALDFPLQQPNPRGLDWWRATAAVVEPYLAQEAQGLLRAALVTQEAFAASAIHRQLPRGPIHADLFRDNVMFAGDRLTGFFDFYFAGCDAWIFDVAVTVNDWCIDRESLALDEPRVRAMLDAYHAARPFTLSEKAAWRTMLQAGALRFWLSRLYDFHLPREAEVLTPHDPAHFERMLRRRSDDPLPDLF